MKGKEQDHLKKTSLKPLRQGQRLDTSETHTGHTGVLGRPAHETHTGQTGVPHRSGR
jgi:hypothetical protein